MFTERKERTKITKDLINNIKRYIEMDKTNKEIQELTNLFYSCVLKLINRINAGENERDILSVKKGPKFKENNVIKNQIIACLNQDNSYFQAEIVENLQAAGIVRSQSFVSRILNKMNITRKRLTKIPIERNSIRILDSRKSYAREVINYTNEKFVYLDETGFNLHTSTNYGYSLKNTKAYAVFPSNKGINVSVMVAINLNGIVAFELKNGAYNGELFIRFITNKLVRYFDENPGSILVMDNCKFHHSKEVLKVLNEKRIIFKFLPPYSPQLNPIEEFFNELKANYKRIRPRSKTREIIKKRVNDLLETRDETFIRYFEHTRNFLSLSISRQLFI